MSYTRLPRTYSIFLDLARVSIGASQRFHFMDVTYAMSYLSDIMPEFSGTGIVKSLLKKKSKNYFLISDRDRPFCFGSVGLLPKWVGTGTVGRYLT